MALLAAAVLAAACDAGADGDDVPPGDEQVAAPGEGAAGAPAPPAEGGTVVWGFAQEPLTLNPTVEDGNVAATTQVALATVLPLWVLTPDWEYEPTALLDRAEVDDEGPRFTVTYHLAADAGWSDGTPVTAADVFFTLETCLDPRWEITVREGCAAVDMAATRERLEPDGKAIEVVFHDEHAAWQTLFSTADGIILPSHLLDGEDWNRAWEAEIPIASGPFRFASWERGESLTLVRNEAYAGPPAAIDRLVLAFARDTDALLERMRAGEVHLLEPPARLDVVQRLRAIDGVEVQTADGPVWEQISFQQAQPLLAEPDVRRALAQAIDRQEIVEELVVPLHPDAQPLGSLVAVRGQPGYTDHLGDLHDPEAAAATLDDHGCRLDEPEGVRVCQGTPLTLEYTTTAGDVRRELTFALVRDHLAEVGVEVTPRFAEPRVVFSDQVLTARAWDLLGFAWVAGADPATNLALWTCGGDRNHTGHCDRRTDQLLAASAAEVDPDARAALLDRAGERLAEDLPVLPLYQLPSVLAVDADAVTGPVANPTQWGPIWNVAGWRAVQPADDARPPAP